MIYLCCLRCLRDLEKWSWIEKIGKNRAKMGKNGCPRVRKYTLLPTFLLFIRPSKRCIMGSPGEGGSHSLSGAYLQDYASYDYEISWVGRSHQNRVQCTGTITLVKFSSYCPLFIFILKFCPEHIS